MQDALLLHCRAEGPPYRAIRAAMKRANADQVVTNWIQLIVKYFSRPASQFGGIASGAFTPTEA